MVVVVCNMPKSLVIAFVLSFAACQQNTTGSRLLQGPYIVNYTIRTSDSSTQGSNGDLVERIRFDETYVILENKAGSGRLLPVDRLIEFRWRKSK